jgi:hypothetical protein
MLLGSPQRVVLTPAHKTASRADTCARVGVEINEALEHISGPSSPFDPITAQEAHRFHQRNVEKPRGKGVKKRKLAKKPK